MSSLSLHDRVGGTGLGLLARAGPPSGNYGPNSSVLGPVLSTAWPGAMPPIVSCQNYNGETTCVIQPNGDIATATSQEYLSQDKIRLTDAFNDAQEGLIFFADILCDLPGVVNKGRFLLLPPGCGNAIDLAVIQHEKNEAYADISFREFLNKILEGVLNGAPVQTL